jgi:hypothetical protein
MFLFDPIFMLSDFTPPYLNEKAYSIKRLLGCILIKNKNCLCGRVLDTGRGY